jgi:uncharacterized alpha/beta hydrolase family protein
MRKYLNLQELSTFCQQNNLQTRVRYAKNSDVARAIIKEVLPDNKDTSLSTVMAYRNILKTLRQDNEVTNINQVNTIVPNIK